MIFFPFTDCTVLFSCMLSWRSAFEFVSMWMKIANMHCNTYQRCISLTFQIKSKYKSNGSSNSNRKSNVLVLMNLIWCPHFPHKCVHIHFTSTCMRHMLICAYYQWHYIYRPANVYMESNGERRMSRKNVEGVWMGWGMREKRVLREWKREREIWSAGDTHS